MVAEPTRRLFTVDEYYRMAEAGILCEDDRVELVEGEIVEMPPIGSQHASAVRVLNNFFARRLQPTLAIMSVQDPVRINDQTELLPDVCLLKPRSDFYSSAHPTAEDVLLLIEVSDTTLAYDSGRKQALYADAAIPEYWVVDVTHRCIQVYRGPASGNYKQRLIMETGETIAPLAFPDATVAVDSLFGP